MHHLALLLALAPLEGPGMHFIDVGQGSSLLLAAPDGVFVLVDAGPSAGAPAISRALAEHGVDELALWILTHHDADHIGGFAPVLAGLDGVLDSPDDIAVAQLWDRGLADPLPQTDAMALYLALSGGLRERPEDGAVFERAGLRVEVLALDEPPIDAPENDRGVVLCVELDGMRVLLPGDASRERMELAAERCPDVDVLWASHHGSATAGSAVVFEHADPQLVVISAGHENAYCHPSPLSLSLAGARTTLVLDAAGIGPGSGCAPLVGTLGPEQWVVGGDVWVDPWLRAWGGGIGGWAALPSSR